MYSFSISGYAIKNDYLGFIVTNYPPATNVNEYLSIMKGVTFDMLGVLDGKKPTNIK